jgi:GT2 family glycosyltransferase
VRFSVLIATKGRPRELERTLDALARCAPQPDEVVVADGDEGGSAEPVSAAYARRDDSPELHYVSAPPGLTRQRNRAVARASGDVLVFIDDDVVADPRLFAELARAYEDPAVLGATGRVHEGDPRRFGNKRSLVRRLVFGRGKAGTMTRFGYPRRLQDPDTERDVEFMQGCLMSGRREAVQRVGFDERLTGYALCEDEDFSFRLSRIGRVRYMPGAVVHHKNIGFRSSATREFNRDVVVNRAYLFRKNFHQTRRTRTQFAGLLLVLLMHRIVNWEWEGARGLLEGTREAWRSGH